MAPPQGHGIDGKFSAVHRSFLKVNKLQCGKRGMGLRVDISFGMDKVDEDEIVHLRKYRDEGFHYPKGVV